MPRMVNVKMKRYKRTEKELTCFTVLSMVVKK